MIDPRTKFVRGREMIEFLDNGRELRKFGGKYIDAGHYEDGS